MARNIVSIFSICLTFLLLAERAYSEGPPSELAKAQPGAMGTFDFKPQDWKSGVLSYWKDTDGVDPRKAGCHIGTDKIGEPNGRMFGEACLADSTLVESNPGAGVLHSHKNDIGHPDKFDCKSWCSGKGFSGGKCVSASAPPCKSSAICSCN